MTLSTFLQPVPLGIAAGLVAGKPSASLARRGCYPLGGRGSPRARLGLQFFGVCVLCGVGFTMSLFIGALAFSGQGPTYETQVKLGVLCGS